MDPTNRRAGSRPERARAFCGSAPRLLACAAWASLLATSTAAAQACDGPDVVCEKPSVYRGTDYHSRALLSAGVTATLGGLTAGVRAYFGGHEFWPAFRGGFAGGTLNFVGRYVSGRRGTATGIAGRQISAVGASLVLNASEGRSSFDRLVLPVGLVWVSVDRSDGFDVDLSVDVTGAIATAYLVGRGSAIDWDRSLSSGVPVFVGGNDPLVAGRHIASVLELRREYPALMDATLAHERVHVAQSDFGAIAWSLPAERAIMRWIGIPDAIAKRLHFGAHHLVRLGTTAIVPYERDPWEWDARLLSDTDDY